ncbi:conserved hypothetical protein [Ricinus communis]|uniref:Uncharacterized protein n=1 Tax=Ricinus communis TaxID=3988 RepID=B9SFP4_RICCO|nr:conserved hypothetical protein [Ricinus communis]
MHADQMHTSVVAFNYHVAMSAEFPIDTSMQLYKINDHFDLHYYGLLFFRDQETSCYTGELKLTIWLPLNSSNSLKKFYPPSLRYFPGLPGTNTDEEKTIKIC